MLVARPSSLVLMLVMINANTCIPVKMGAGTLTPPATWSVGNSDALQSKTVGTAGLEHDWTKRMEASPSHRPAAESTEESSSSSKGDHWKQAKLHAKNARNNAGIGLLSGAFSPVAGTMGGVRHAAKAVKAVKQGRLVKGAKHAGLALAKPPLGAVGTVVGPAVGLGAAAVGGAKAGGHAAAAGYERLMGKKSAQAKAQAASDQATGEQRPSPNRVSESVVSYWFRQPPERLRYGPADFHRARQEILHPVRDDIRPTELSAERPTEPQHAPRPAEHHGETSRPPPKKAGPKFTATSNFLTKSTAYLATPKAKWPKHGW